MEAIGSWLAAELGLAPWIVGLLVLPVLSVSLIYGIREVILVVVSRFAAGRAHKEAWRRATRYVAVVLSLVAVVTALNAYAAEIATALTPDGEARTEHILIAVVRTVGLTALLALLLLGVKRGFATLDVELEKRFRESTGIRFQGVVFVDPEQLADLVRLALRVVRFGLVLFLFYLYIPLVLTGIPWTQPFAHRVMPLVLKPLAGIALAIVRYIPNLITLILILVVFRWVMRLFRTFMDAVGRGDLKLGSFNPAWAASTFRLVHALAIIFAIVLIYPFLPGSDSAVFKGVSVFLGALATFGGRSSVSDLISGLMLTYNETFEAGDRVRVGGTTGDVLHIGMFFTLIQTLDNERVSIPNSVAMKGEIFNVSEAAKAGGLKLRVGVGIGYDAEWQQVYELLIGAAEKTNNVRSDPQPLVEQYSLDDYAVAYTLVVVLEDAKKRFATRTELLENIQDAFNEAGLEIMTPAVRAVRDSLDPAIPGKYMENESSEAARRETGSPGS
ncbi:MAG: mechanosensitive ion channel domain-containing protein [Gemmatimonadota bacterium]